MNISNWILTGDTHGRVSERLGNIKRSHPDLVPEETAIIILGDAGINFWLNKTDKKNKKDISAFGYTIYCVRGNHEERPENLDYIEHWYDNNVKGYIMMEPEFPLIKYFEDGGSYEICGHSVLVIGGAYSVDKWHRLARAQANGNSFSGWFEDEQLAVWEMIDIEGSVAGKKYDFVFTHTCPVDWEPTDLFLSFIDQSQVDKTMENWLNEIKDTFTWGVWCFGHFHDDRIERAHVEQFFMDYENLETVWNRWQEYDKTGEIDFRKSLSPTFEQYLLYKKLNGNKEN
jgi:3-oxoacid CoA-transferase subunit A